ncbi:MAG: quinolinate synthetase complex, subunit [Thermoleophilia bacterium]|nr:quinolinate synthetase complex, subunit [Thermoleophilia bacterium]
MASLGTPPAHGDASLQIPLDPSAADPERQAALLESIERLRVERNAVILAHNYQYPEIQDLADFVGDSLGLSQFAATTDADMIVFCGVHFMAETAKILNPRKTVLLPDLAAGCSLADTITGAQLREWKAQFPDAVVVSYVNTTAEVKAESDYCCTSGNAQAIIEAIPADRTILFCPDMFLGTYLESVTGRKMQVWLGECHVHAGIRPDDLNARLTANPAAELLVHPECGCASSCLYRVSTGELPADRVQVLGTEAMLRRVASSPSDEFIVATESGIIHRMRQEAPEKVFRTVSERAICRYMKEITLENLEAALRLRQHVIEVDSDVAARAELALRRMIEIV